MGRLGYSRSQTGRKERRKDNEQGSEAGKPREGQLEKETSVGKEARTIRSSRTGKSVESGEILQRSRLFFFMFLAFTPVLGRGKEFKLNGLHRNKTDILKMGKKWRGQARKQRERSEEEKTNRPRSKREK